jgi:hypothetical protein
MKRPIALINLYAIAFKKYGQCCQNGRFSNVISANESRKVIYLDFHGRRECAKIFDLNAP